jgi:hypothetical protein
VVTRSKTTRLVAPEGVPLSRFAQLLDAIEPFLERPAEVRPAAPGPAKVETSAQADCKRFIGAFGPQGGVWFAEGKTFAECRQLEIAELRQKNEILSERLKQAGGGKR